MLTITFTRKDKGDDDSADYDYVVYANTTRIARGEITGHRRSTNWRGLVDELNQVKYEAIDINLEDETMKKFLKLLERRKRGSLN